MASGSTRYEDYVRGFDDHVRGWDVNDQNHIIMEEVKFQAWPPLHLLGWTPGLGLTCRQLHFETNAMLYGANVFNFDSWKEFHCFKSISGQHCIGLLQHLEVPFPMLNGLAAIIIERPSRAGGRLNGQAMSFKIWL